METIFYFYIAGWSTACLIALGMYLADRPSYVISHRRYWRFLALPWKLVWYTLPFMAFAVAAVLYFVLPPLLPE